MLLVPVDSGRPPDCWLSFVEDFESLAVLEQQLLGEALPLKASVSVRNFDHQLKISAFDHQVKRPGLACLIQV